jgi:heptosyltransferase-2
MTRILVVAPSWVGDAVLAQPMLARLKEREPGARIDVLGPDWVLPVFRRMPEVDGAIANPFGHGALQLGARRRFARSLPAYDCALVLPNSFKSALIPWHAGIPVRTGYRGEWRYGLLNDLRVLDETALPLMVSRFAALAEPKTRDRPRRQKPGSVPDFSPPRLTVAAEARDATLAKFGLALDRPVAAFCPGAEYGPAKRWPERHFAALAATLAGRGMQVWLFGSAKDSAITAAIQSQSGGVCVDLAGKTSLDEAIDLLSCAAGVVSNDSGLMHIAAALDRPMAALFGSSSPRFTPPLSPRAQVVSLQLACSPCFQRECPLGHFDCLMKLEPGRVAAALDAAREL